MPKHILIMIVINLLVFATGSAAAGPRAEEGTPAAEYSREQRELGIVILTDFSVEDGVLVFRAASGGCTDRGHFKVTVEELHPIVASARYYRLTVTRIRSDDCKGLFPDGVEIRFDLEQDLGLVPPYTFTVANPVASRGW
ncbi:MAG TPA: hypothetical protein ENN69_08830 [Spirochaetia bacterium]|nr:hypothetical protein [Spirochaetia bacterium]